MRKAIIFIAALVLAMVAALGVMTAQYSRSYEYKSNRFEDGYIINGVRCYGLNYDQASEKIESQWNTKDIIVVGALDELLGTISKADCKFDIEDQVAKAKKNNRMLSALNHYLNVPVSVKIPMTVKSSSKKFEKSVKEMDFLSREDMVESRDAYVDIKDPEFRIVEEVYGNKPDGDKFFKDVVECIETGRTKMIFTDDKYISSPKVKEDDPKLLEYQKFCREHLDRKIKYDMGKESYTLTREDLNKLYDDDLSGKANKKAVKKFVKGIAEKYDNVGEITSFKSLTGKTVEIGYSEYGWQVDQEEETDQLIKDIESDKDVSREPEWAVTGYGKYSHGIGNTYVDIDISNQTLIYFENGKRILATDIVTGSNNVAEYRTPTGLFSVLNKATDITLKGRNSNGTKYSSFVNYWMAFSGSAYGIHDASWRSAFGGSIYQGSGSHGCVNVPPANMPKIFDAVDYSTPVVVHY